MTTLAFYLPQFHPILENDDWWGVGFTEWRNVVRSKPRYGGHRQPQIPRDLGFYDLRCIETLDAQAQMAVKNGIDGFCVYHYWFEGRRLLERPMDLLLENPGVNFNHCLCWANETWSRTWDGNDREVLVRQTYSTEDDLKHAGYLSSRFLDPRYIKINGQPLFLIYRPTSHPDLGGFVSVLRNAAISKGLPSPFVLGCYTGFDNQPFDVAALGLDGVVNFQPNRISFPVPKGFRQYLIAKSRELLPAGFYDYLKSNASAYKLVNYSNLVDNVLKSYLDMREDDYPVVFPNWDNSPRRTTPTIIQNNRPEDFGRWIDGALTQARRTSANLLFVNAWNEWAEGCHLEPDIEMGSVFLETLSRAVKGA